MARRPSPQPRRPERVAIIGAGLAGIVCARTLRQAGIDITVFESAAVPGGRMAHRSTPFGTFDTGAQYFTVRDARFAKTLEATAPGLCRPWSASTVRVLDAHGMVAAAGLATRDAHYVALPGMGALAVHWARPLAADGALHLGTRVTRIARDAVDGERWQLHTSGDEAADAHPVHSGFDAVLLATPAGAARALLAATDGGAALARKLAAVRVAPCWTLQLAFPQAARPGLGTLGPQWNAARSTHHRIAWLARESSKPGRGAVERWTVQASPAWSAEHAGDSAERVSAKLLRAFAEITGIRAQPAFAETLLWTEAQTSTPLSVGTPEQTHLWDAPSGLGACGDWCLGHRVENAFVSGLSLALEVHGA